MRAIILVIGCILFFSARAQRINTFYNVTGSPYMEGKIRNYKPSENNRFLTLRTYDVEGKHKDTAVLIKPDGSFFIRYQIPYPSDVLISYRGTFVKLLSDADRHVKFDIDDKLWVANENKSLAFIPNDENSRNSRIVIDFDYQFARQKFNTEVDWNDKSKTDEEMVNVRLRKLQEELQYVEQYGKEKKISGYYVHRRIKNMVRFEAACEIAFTLFTSSRHRSFTHDQLFGLLKHFPVDSMIAPLNSAYYRFNRLFTGGLTISYNINPAYEELRKQANQNRFPMILDRVDSHYPSNTTSPWRALIYYNLFMSHRLDQTAFFDGRLYAGANDQLLRDRMDMFRASRLKPFAEFDLLEKLKAYDVEASLKNRLIRLLENEKEKYVYMDFWGTWCAPCMREMPHYAELISRLKGKNISFLFMGVDTPEEEALKVKEKYRIDGNFITLNDSEIAILRNLLPINGYPTHILLKPGSVMTGYTGENLSWGDQFNGASVKKIESYLTTSQ
jgi:thiol-disulfide isomerase/thioredoxin